MAPATFAVAAAGALAGGYWDDAWHTERGRDDFFIAPHIAIYLGIAIAGLALAAALSGRDRAERSGVLLKIGLVTLLGTMASGPLDNAWHEAFGRDAVLWSPPHMLGIVGSLGLAYVMLLHLSSAPKDHRVLAPAVGGLVVAAAAFSVAEYETDVPQFGPVWYPIVLAFAATVALRLVANAQPNRRAATEAAAVQTVFAAATGVLLLGLGYDAPWVSLVLVPAVALDLAARRSWGYGQTAGAVALPIALGVVPARNVLGDLGISAAEVGLAVIGAWVASVVALWLADGAPRIRRRRGLIPAVGAAALLLPGIAQAHDPGQGEPAGVVDWRAQTNGQRVAAVVVADRLCDGATARLIARRGGELIQGADLRGECRRSGSLSLNRPGRWFLYLEIDRPTGQVESWIPIDAGKTATVVEPQRYAYRPRPAGRADEVKLTAGVILYSAIAMFLVLLARAARRLQPTVVPTRTIP